MAWPYWRARIRACLIDDLRRAHRLWSIRLAGAGTAFSGACIALGITPASHWITLTLFIATGLARLLHQGAEDNG
jgi:hypothetical protein